ncbi:MAG: ATP-binding protein [Saprospiraceae bacterium]
MNRSVAIYLLILICTCSFSHAQSPTYDIQYLSTENGMSSGFVDAILQDQNGFMWFGTKFGLNRFDGENFESFTKANNNLRQNDIVELIEDVDGNIWTIFYEDRKSDNYLISIFNPRTKQAKNFKEVFPNIPFYEKDISKWSFFKDGKNIWFNTKDGSIYKYDGQFTLFAKNEIYKNTKIRWIDGACWLAKKGTLIQLSEQGVELNRFTLKEREIYDFGENTKGEIWIVFQEFQILYKEILFITKDNQESRTVTFGKEEDVEKRIFDVQHYLDKNGQDIYWFAGVNFVKLFDSEGKELESIDEQIEQEKPVFGSKIIFQDRDGNIWLKYQAGLILVSPHDILFRKHLEKNKLKSIRGIERINEEELFVATYNGFFILNKKTGKEQRLLHDLECYYGLGVELIDNEIIMGYHGNLYLSYDLQTKKMKSYSQDIKFGNNKLEMSKFEIFSFYTDRYQHIWVLTNYGLFQLDTEKKQIHYPKSADINHTFYQTTINHILENEDGLWVSTDKGFFLINHDGSILQDFEKLKNFKINFSYQSSNDDFWFTTKGSGLLHWNKKTNKLETYTTKDGLPHDHLYSIHEDKLGYFWVPSNNGLIRLNPTDFSINIFTEVDGLANNEFNTYSNFVDDDGKIFLGSINGLISFDPMDFDFINQENPPLSILSFSKTKEDSGKEIDETDQLIKQQAIYISPNDRYFDLSFSLLDYHSSYQPIYAYQIKGYDETWNILEENRIKINRLPYGKYELKIKGQSKYGKWSDQQIILPLIISKPFYLTIWFFTGAIFLLVGLLYGLFRYRLFRLEKEKLRLEKIVDERTKELAGQTKKLKKYNQMKDEFFAIIAHDLRGPVVSFQNMSRKVKFLNEEGSQKDVDVMLELVDTAADSLNTLLDNLLNWALIQKGIFPYRPNELKLEKMINETVQLFSPMAEIKGIRIEQNISDQILIKADKDAIKAILRNLVSNAIKFSSQGDLIKINAKTKNGNVLLQIEDSGMGMPPEVIEKLFVLHGEKIKRGTKGEKGSGLGLVLCKELIELNNGSIEVKSELEKGTAFSILVPRN